MCGTFATWSKAIAGCDGDAWPECDQQRRHLPHAEGHGNSWLVRPFNPCCCKKGASTVRPAGQNQAGYAGRLQSIRMCAVPAELRLGEARREARVLSDNGLHGGECRVCRPSYRVNPGETAVRQKNRNGSPATGQTTGSSSRHGTSGEFETVEVSVFVPPRDKTPCFSGRVRPATGHLYRFTICTAVGGGDEQRLIDSTT